MVTSAHSSRWFLAPGDKLGKHQVICQIAVGGMAELYLARTVEGEGLERLACIKRVVPKPGAGSSFASTFLLEARRAATLRHPKVAQVFDTGQESGGCFVSMEYVHGEDLGRLIAVGRSNGVPLSLERALSLASGVCAGLHHAHEQTGPDGKPLGMVHGAVSPSNVLVGYDGVVKVVEFGIARAGGAVSQEIGGTKGKSSYLSPEQCRGQGTLDRRSDVFSTGTLLYELTTGRLPFVGETEQGVRQQIASCDAEPPSKLVPDYPPALEAIVMRALAREPGRRFATVLELQQQIEGFAQGQGVRISPVVVAHLMATLFPGGFEAWEHARHGARSSSRKTWCGP